MDEVDEVIRWSTGYSQKRLESELGKGTDFETFFAEAPNTNPDRSLITGAVCGSKNIGDPTMREIRYLASSWMNWPKRRPWTRSCGTRPASRRRIWISVRRG